MDHPYQRRKNERLVVRIDGRDSSGHFFREQVAVTRISNNGALLLELPDL